MTLSLSERSLINELKQALMIGGERGEELKLLLTIAQAILLLLLQKMH